MREYRRISLDYKSISIAFVPTICHEFGGKNNMTEQQAESTVLLAEIALKSALFTWQNEPSKFESFMECVMDAGRCVFDNAKTISKISKPLSSAGLTNQQSKTPESEDKKQEETSQDDKETDISGIGLSPYGGGIFEIIGPCSMEDFFKSLGALNEEDEEDDE